MAAGPAPARRPLRVGVQLPEVEWAVRWTDLAAIVRRLEELGFDSVWLGEHLLYRAPGEPARGPWEAWTELAALAAVTSRIQLGPLVSATSFHNPAMLAKQAATVDEISNGRLVLGLGAGWNRVEFDAYGFPYDDRVSRFEEAFTIVRTLLAEGRIDHAGRYYQLRDCELVPRSPRPGGPPLLIGSNGERMLRISLPYVAAWNTWFTGTANRPEGVRPLRELVDRICREVGRDPAEVERSCAVYVQMSGGRGRNQPGGPPAETPLRGTPEEIAEALRGFAREGIAEAQLVLDPITLASVEAVAPVLEILDRG